MVRVIIGRRSAPSQEGSSLPITVDGARGERLLDLLDEVGSPIGFACRSATCGSCRVTVERGAELLEAPRASERETLLALGCGPATRLACQLRVSGATGEVHLTPFAPT